MASEITYAEVRFQNNAGSPDPSAHTHSSPPDPSAHLPQVPNAKATTQPSTPGISKLLFILLAMFSLLLAILFFVLFIVFFQKYSQLLKERTTALPYENLNCTRSSSSNEGNVWSCCPLKWLPFGSHCYFVSDYAKTWEESEAKCSSMRAHLLVINSKEEQDFITKRLDKHSAYYLGLWDPSHRNDWQWVDQMPYNQSATFWHRGEPNNAEEACVVINSPLYSGSWGWNDIPCTHRQRFICETMAVYL